VTDIVMPRLSDSMEEGTILKWLKAEGDEVAVGDELVEIETDKANMVYESDAAGTLSEILAQEGDTLPIGEVIARVGAAGDGKPATKADAPTKKEVAEAAGDGASAAGDGASTATVEAPAPPAPAPAAPAPAPAAPAPAGSGRVAEHSGVIGGDGRVKASPLAKRIARDRGIDLAGLSGSGPGGRIVKADVERAVGAPSAAPARAAAAHAPAGLRESVETAKGEVQVLELTKLQQAVARRMAESKATAPHFYLTTEVDMTRAVEARARIKDSAAEGDVVPSFNDMVIKACAIALREHPRANGAYRDGKVELYSRVNVGVAVAAQDALVVPTVFDTDLKGLRQIATEVRDLAGKVREGTITPPELSGGTFTVSNLGMYGVTSFSAVINPPQAGILAVGSIERRPAFDDDGGIYEAQTMSITLACDHRILYGSDGAEFLGRIRALLEEPLGLAL
jgi:pyruvate dehydrogenase E2 component (dihydrolipoyllysine-residue acetyltransferase)